MKLFSKLIIFLIIFSFVVKVYTSFSQEEYTGKIVFKDGTTCNFTASRVSLNRQRRFRVFEKGAYYVVDTLEKSYFEVKVNIPKKEYKQDKKVYSESDPLKEELESFVKNVLAGKKVEVSGEDGLRSLRIAFKIKKQVEENLRRFL